MDGEKDRHMYRRAEMDGVEDGIMKSTYMFILTQALLESLPDP